MVRSGVVALIPKYFILKKGGVTILPTMSYEPPRGKTNNVVSKQVRHKPTCTSTEAGYKLEILDL